MEKINIDMFGLGNVKLYDGNHYFRFTCDMCGSCCIDNTIILNTYDIIRLVKRLKITSYDFLKNYCTPILGKESKLPLVLLKMNPLCVFSKNGLCTVYEDRPQRCRMFPIGRVVKISKDNTEKETKYMVMKNCSKKSLRSQHLHTVKEWLKNQDCDEFITGADIFSEFITELDNKGYPKCDAEFNNKFVSIFYDIDNVVLETGIVLPPIELAKFITMLGKKILIEKR